VFLPGGMGVNFVSSSARPGSPAPPLSCPPSRLMNRPAGAAGRRARLLRRRQLGANLDTPENKAFVTAYEKEFDAVPATYAFQAYDAALLIDSAVRQVRGNVGNKDALRAAMMKADFSHCAAASSSIPTIIRSRTSTRSRLRSAPTANFRPKSRRKCSRIIPIRTSRIAR
jgi:branched-chain amino acid transport system substrate-binding protein